MKIYYYIIKRIKLREKNTLIMNKQQQQQQNIQL
jgi:hypothetical protein